MNGCITTIKHCPKYLDPSTGLSFGYRYISYSGTCLWISYTYVRATVTFYVMIDHYVLSIHLSLVSTCHTIDAQALGSRTLSLDAPSPTLDSTWQIEPSQR